MIGEANWQETFRAKRIQVTGYDPTPEGLAACLKGAEIVVIPAGVPRKPGMTRDGMLRWQSIETAQSIY